MKRQILFPHNPFYYELFSPAVEMHTYEIYMCIICIGGLASNICRLIRPGICNASLLASSYISSWFPDPASCYVMTLRILVRVTLTLARYASIRELRINAGEDQNYIKADETFRCKYNLTLDRGKVCGARTYQNIQQEELLFPLCQPPTVVARFTPDARAAAAIKIFRFFEAVKHTLRACFYECLLH